MTKNNIKELSIQVNLNGLSFCVLNRTTNTINYLNQLHFKNQLSPQGLLDSLKQELSTNTIFSDDFDEVLVIHQNELASLVPKELFDESLKADYLKFNAKILRTDFITHDDIAINESVNVYVPYVNINNYIFDTFGPFVYKHSSSVLIDAALQRHKDDSEALVYINVNLSSIEVLVLQNMQLQLFNSFDYFSKEDFIYYILFVFEQLDLDVETVGVKLSGQIDEKDDLFKVLFTYIRHISFVDLDFGFEVSQNGTKDTLHQYFLILNSF